MSETKLINTLLFTKWPNGLIAVNQQGRIIAFSERATKITGWTRSDYYKKTPHELLCTNTRQYSHSEEDCPLKPSNINDEFISVYWKKKDGENISVDVQAFDLNLEDANYLIQFIDNSEREHNQEELDKFSEYVNKNPSAIAEFDSIGQIIYGNDAFNTYLDKFDFNDLGQANILPDDIETLCSQTFDRGELNQTGSAVIKEVEDHFIRWHFQLIETAGTHSILGYAFDITAQKQAELLAEKQKSQSRKEHFAKMVHELRTPLNAIIGFSDILLNRVSNKLSEHEIKRLQSIKNAGLQLNDLVTDTLDFSKIESGKMSLDISEFSISDVARALHEQMNTLAEQKGLLYNYESNSTRTLFSDKTKVRQIIVNLVSNAVKYTKNGQVDLVITETADLELEECFKISVHDTGIGIPEDKIPSLFTSYEQVESEDTKNIQGTGLGLALVKDLVNLLGGKINVSSLVGKGSSFEVLLPYSSSFND